MKRNKDRIIRTILGLTLMVCGLFYLKNSACASDQLTGSFQTTTRELTAYDSADTSAGQTQIGAGEMVLVEGQENGWFHIMYKGSDLYVSEADSDALGGLADEAAAQELEKRSQTDKAWIESYVAQMKAARSARIWRIAIICIIVVAVVAIVVTSIRHNSSDKGESAKE